MRRLKTIGLIVVAVMVIVIALGEMDTSPSRATSEPAEPDPKRLAVIAGAIELKRMAHDPASFELVQALQMDDGAGCYTYRAKNGFGAVRTGHAVMRSGSIVTSEDERFGHRWRSHCEGKRGVQIK